MSDLKQIMRLKEDLKDAHNERQQLEGQKQAYLQELKTTFKCTSLKQAEDKYEDLSKELTGEEKKLESLIERFNEEFADVL